MKIRCSLTKSLIFDSTEIYNDGVHSVSVHKVTLLRKEFLKQTEALGLLSRISTSKNKPKLFKHVISLSS